MARRPRTSDGSRSGVLHAVALIRSVVPPLDADRIMTGDLAAVRLLITSGKLRAAVEKAVGELR